MPRGVAAHEALRLLERRRAFQNEAREMLGLVGDDAPGNARVRKSLQQFGDAGEKHGFRRKARFVVGEKLRFEGLESGRAGRDAHRGPEKAPGAFARGFAQGGVRQGRQAPRRAQGVRGGRELRRRIRERAVEVKEDGRKAAARHHAFRPEDKCSACRRRVAERFFASTSAEAAGRLAAAAFSCASSSSCLSQRSFSSCCSTATMA